MDGDRCDFCDGRLTSRRIREYYRMGKGIVVIDDVPAYVCSQCGERYFDSTVAEEMRALARGRSRLLRRISFPRVRFRKTRASA